MTPKDIIKRQIDAYKIHGGSDEAAAIMWGLVNALMAAGFVIVPVSPRKKQVQEGVKAIEYFRRKGINDDATLAFNTYANMIDEFIIEEPSKRQAADEAVKNVAVQTQAQMQTTPRRR